MSDPNFYPETMPGCLGNCRQGRQPCDCSAEAVIDAPSEPLETLGWLLYGVLLLGSVGLSAAWLAAGMGWL